MQEPFKNIYDGCCQHNPTGRPSKEIEGQDSSVLRRDRRRSRVWCSRRLNRRNGVVQGERAFNADIEMADVYCADERTYSSTGATHPRRVFEERQTPRCSTVASRQAIRGVPISKVEDADLGSSSEFLIVEIDGRSVSHRRDLAFAD